MKFKGFLSVMLMVVMVVSGCASQETETPDAAAADTTTEAATTEVTTTVAEETTTTAEITETAETTEAKEEADATSGASEVTLEPLSFETMPTKVAVGTVGLSEVFAALDIDLVGAPSTRSYKIPEKYAALPTIGMSMQPDAEVLKGLEVDMFITDASLQSSLEASLTDKNIPAAFVATSGYDEMMFSVASIGNAFGKMAEAGKLLGEMKAAEGRALALADGKEAPTVMIIFGTSESFMLATDASYIGDLAHRLNMTNVTDEMQAMAPFMPFSIEDVVASNPDVILRFTHADPETSRQMFEKEFAENAVWQAMDAVKNDRVYDLDPHYFGVVANVRCAQSLEQLATMIYGQE